MKRESKYESTLMEDIAKLRELSKPTISQQEAETCQKWARLDGATAFHLIERHAANWNDVGLMMEAWLKARSAPSEKAGPADSSWKAAYERANAEVMRLADLLRKADPKWGSPMRLNANPTEREGKA